MNVAVTICFRANPDEAARIDAAVEFDGKRTRAEWLKEYVMGMVEICEAEMIERLCKVDLSRAPGLVAALSNSRRDDNAI